VLQNSIACKNPLPSAGFEPANLGSNGKHTNHYTTEATQLVLGLCHFPYDYFSRAFSSKVLVYN
jgi:hypothetical protein